MRSTVDLTRDATASGPGDGETAEVAVDDDCRKAGHVAFGLEKEGAATTATDSTPAVKAPESRPPSEEVCGGMASVRGDAKRLRQEAFTGDGDVGGRADVEGGDSETQAQAPQCQDISEYEQQRRERIRKNQAFMAALGLDTAKPRATASLADGANVPGTTIKMKRSRPVGKAVDDAPTMPMRRSTRRNAGTRVDYGDVSSSRHSPREVAREESSSRPSGS